MQTGPSIASRVCKTVSNSPTPPPKMSGSDWLLQQEKVDARSVVLTLIDNGKLAYQIARLQAISVKTEIFKKSPLNLKY